MNQAKIDTLKRASEAANGAYESEKARLTAAGLKSQERYAALAPLKASADKAHTAYSKYAANEIKSELDKIINEDRPAREAAARARSPWKQAKFEARNGR